MDIQPLSCKSRVSSGNLRVKQNEDGTYDLAQFTTEGRYAVGYYGYSANDLLNLAMSIKEYVNRTQLAKEGKRRGSLSTHGVPLRSLPPYSPSS